MDGKKIYYVEEDSIYKLEYIFTSNEIKKLGYNIKDDYISLKPYGIKLENIYFDITIMSEDEKDKLRGLLKFLHGDRNNMPVYIKINNEIKPSQPIYFTPNTENIIKRIIDEKKISIKK